MPQIKKLKGDLLRQQSGIKQMETISDTTTNKLAVTRRCVMFLCGVPSLLNPSDGPLYLPSAEA